MNVLYKVWGIITYVFTGFYAVGWLAFFILMGIGGAEAKGAVSQAPYFLWSQIESEFAQAAGMFVLAVLLLALVVLIGLIVRILAGVYLTRAFVKSRGALIAVAVFYIIITFLNLSFAVIWGKAKLLGFMFFFLFCMGWGLATGVFLLLKQAGAAASVPCPKDYIPYADIGVQGVHEPQGSVEGLFGDFVGKKYRLKPGESCKIGRDSGCEIRILHRQVSRVHCLVKFLPDGRFEVTDMSYNGTFYENETLPSGVAVTVEAKGKLVIGEADNVLALNVE